MSKKILASLSRVGPSALGISMKRAFATILAIAFLSSPAWADSIVFLGTDDIGAFGFGHDPRDLTIQSHGQGSSSESGCIAPDGMGGLLEGSSACGPLTTTWASDTATGGDEDSPLGFPKQAAPTLGSLGIKYGGQIGIVFDGVQPQNSDNLDMTINDLTLKLYNPQGVLIYDVSLVPTDLVLPTNPGNGNSDYIFTLDAAAANDFNLALLGITPATDAAGAFIALDSTLSFPNKTGGPDSFTIVTLTPEPSSLLLLGTGIVGLAGALRYRMKSSRQV